MSELTFNDFAASQLGNASKLTKDDKFKKLNAALPDLQKQFGKGFLQKLDGKPRKYPHFSTGILPLDIALGIGGVPRGRIIEIFGAESSGKTTVTLHIIAEAQKRGNVCAFVDAEHALDPSYASSLGVVVDELLFSQPDYGEQALEVANKLISTGAIDIIVIDSVAALVPKAEIAGVIGQAFMGLQARMMSQALRIMTGNAAKHGVTVIFINQTRMKIGAMPHCVHPDTKIEVMFE
jgi:recombination protein RecA